MASSPRTPRPEILAEKLLITKLITSVGLALLLLLGASAAERHPDAASAHLPVTTDATSPSTASGSVAIPATAARGVLPAAAVDAAPAGIGAASGTVVSEMESSFGAHLGCLLGVLCGLALFVRGRRWGGRAMPLLTGASLRAPSRLSAPPRRRTGVGLSLSQLGMSRT